MSRANPFGDLDDFTPQSPSRPVPAEAIEEIARASGFPSRKAGSSSAQPGTINEGTKAPPLPSPATSGRTQRRRTTGRNRQINIKATEDTIVELYRVADEMDLPLGAVLERALAALTEKNGAGSKGT